MSSIYTESKDVSTTASSISYPESQHTDVEKAENTTSEWRPSKQVKLIVAIQALVCFVVALDATILTTTLPTLSKALGTHTTTETFWIAASYLLTSAVFQPPIAALSDVFGRRATFFAALSLFTIGSVVCCACNNIAGMLAGRSIQGMGGGGILSLNLIILSDIIPLRQRAQYQGYLQLVFALGSNIAPIVGGAFVEKTSWRWLFYINLPFCGIGLIAVPFVLNYSRPQTSIKKQLVTIDWIGIAMSIASVTSFLVGISWGGTEYSWSSAPTLCPILLGVVGVVCTIIYEKKCAAVPFLRMSIFASRSAIAAYICTMLMAFLVYSTLYYLVLWLIAVKELSAIMAGVAIFPLGLTVVPISGVTGAIITKTGRYQWAVWAGWIIATLGIGVLILLDHHTSTIKYVFQFMCAGIGLGLLMMAHSAAVQAISPTKDVAYASSMFAFMRSLGLCLGVSIGGTIFQNFLTQRLDHFHQPTEIATNAESYIAALRTMPVSAEKELIQAIINWAFQRLFIVLCAICALGMLISFFIGSYSLDKELDSQHMIVQGEIRPQHRREDSSSSKSELQKEKNWENSPEVF